MSKRREPVFVVTGQEWEEEKYEYNWTIKNFQKCQCNPELLKDHKFEVETDDDSPLHSKWAFGLEPQGSSIPSRMFRVCWTLMEIHKPMDTSLIRCKVSIERQNWGGSTDDIKHTGDSDYCKGLTDSMSLAYPTNWNAHGSAVIRLTLRLLKPSDGGDFGLLEKKLRCQSIAAAKANVSEGVASSKAFDTKIFSSDGGQFECHKAILKVSSPVFKSMMESGLSESQSGVVKVADISGKTMEVLVHYMYTGRLQDTWKDSDVILELTYAAGKYQMMSLLEYLDLMLGHVEWESWLLSDLVDLTSKLSLKKAEAMLMKQIVKLTVSAENTTEIATIFSGKAADAKIESS